MPEREWVGARGRIGIYCRRAINALSVGAALTPTLKKGGEGEKLSLSISQGEF
jgi:hypothetical protein